MRLVDAPQPGWYPDPAGGGRLRWWDGLDWSETWRSPPNPAHDVVVVSSGEDGDRSGAPGAGGVADGLGIPRVPPSQRGRDVDMDQIMTEVRRVARSEVDRAGDMLTQRAREASRRLEPLISQYSGEVVRWLKIASYVVVAVLVVWILLQLTAQATIMDWLGDRVDNLLGGATNHAATVRALWSG